MVALAKIPVRMSVDEFLVWAADTPGRWQLVDGVPHAMSPAGVLHRVLQAELARLIGNHLAATGSHCRVIVAPGVIPRVLARINMRVPDLAVTCTAFGPDTRASTEPVLVVEILSPSNQAATWTNVWSYTSIPSVRDIVVLRSDRRAASLLRRGVDGVWPEEPEEIRDGLLLLESVAFSVPLADVYVGTGL
jgi:Uma2 family endonuclease